jgi:hypothetical protein
MCGDIGVLVGPTDVPLVSFVPGPKHAHRLSARARVRRENTLNIGSCSKPYSHISVCLYRAGH